MLKFYAICVFILTILLISLHTSAQQKCEGPPELCAQILQLKSELEGQKKITRELKDADDKQVVALQEKQKDQEQKTIKFVSVMGLSAIILKIILSLLTTWKDILFKSDKGKAAIRLAILVVTVLIFLATNLGFGIPWWQALILAAGGPLSMFIHEMTKLIPVLRGKEKLQE